MRMRKSHEDFGWKGSRLVVKKEMKSFLEKGKCTVLGYYLLRFKISIQIKAECYTQKNITGFFPFSSALHSASIFYEIMYFMRRFLM